MPERMEASIIIGGRRRMGRRAGQRRQDQRVAATAGADVGLRLMPTRRFAAMVVGHGVALALPTPGGSGQQLSAKRDSRCAMAIGEEAEVADAVEAGGQDMQAGTDASTRPARAS